MNTGIALMAAGCFGISLIATIVYLVSLWNLNKLKEKLDRHPPKYLYNVQIPENFMYRHCLQEEIYKVKAFRYGIMLFRNAFLWLVLVFLILSFFF